ncbi:hypothetical protein BKA70DRAFT_1397461 [Coprinopsis sp. MPI-PUGE-AT-0042]|nr:hypothetical protein BKA70DRAFT_1397461 [Coprinopsis sp. MPI-PUGE-AT-0042]
MPKILDMDIALCTEGRRLREYKLEVDKTGRVPVATCWVPSEAGKEFSLWLKIAPSPSTWNWGVKLHLDGWTPTLERSLMRKDKSRLLIQAALMPGNILRSFQFASLESTDDESVGLEANPDLGRIEVELFTYESTTLKGTPTWYVPAALPTVKLHERASKGLTHQVSLGSEKTPSEGYRVYTRGKRLAARVVFMYRSIDVLIAQGVASRDVKLEVPAPVREGVLERGKRARISSLTVETVKGVQIKRPRLSTSPVNAQTNLIAQGAQSLCNPEVKIRASSPFQGRHIQASAVNDCAYHPTSSGVKVEEMAPDEELELLSKGGDLKDGTRKLTLTMPQILGFDIAMVMEGVKLCEYQTELDDSGDVPVVTCWVPSHAGKGFRVSIVPPPAPRDEHWKFGLSLDGLTAQVTGNLLEKSKIKTSVNLQSHRVLRGVLRRFQFAALEPTLANGSPTPNDLGQITVMLNTYKSRSPKKKERKCRDELSLSKKIDGEVKSNLTDCVSLGPERTRRLTKASYVLDGKKLVGKVVFKYRSIDLLRANGVAPLKKRTKSQKSTALGNSQQALINSGPQSSKLGKRKVQPQSTSTSVVIDIEEELERMELEERENRPARDTRDDSSSPPKKKLKVDRKEMPRWAFLPDDVIDLCDD